MSQILYSEYVLSHKRLKKISSRFLLAYNALMFGNVWCLGAPREKLLIY